MYAFKCCYLLVENLILISLENSIESKQEDPLKLKGRQYSYEEVVGITENFGVVLGEGGFGKVYLGSLKDQTTVAVKMLSATSQQGNKEFRIEVHVIFLFFFFCHVGGLGCKKLESS